MNKILAATALGGALFAGALGLAGPASATNGQDVEFIRLLDSHGINANGLGTQWGQGICIDLTNHYSAGWTQTSALQYAVNSVYGNTDANFTSESSKWFVAASITVYCPWYAPTGSPEGTNV